MIKPDDLYDKKLTLKIDGNRTALFYGNKATFDGKSVYSSIGVGYGSKFKDNGNLHR